MPSSGPVRPSECLRPDLRQPISHLRRSTLRRCRASTGRLDEDLHPLELRPKLPRNGFTPVQPWLRSQGQPSIAPLPWSDFSRTLGACTRRRRLSLALDQRDCRLDAPILEGSTRSPIEVSLGLIASDEAPYEPNTCLLPPYWNLPIELERSNYCPPFNSLATEESSERIGTCLVGDIYYARRGLAGWASYGRLLPEGE
jgi:hypothetical protein